MITIKAPEGKLIKDKTTGFTYTEVVCDEKDEKNFEVVDDE